VKKARLYARVG